MAQNSQGSDSPVTPCKPASCRHKIIIPDTRQEKIESLERINSNSEKQSFTHVTHVNRSLPVYTWVTWAETSFCFTYRIYPFKTSCSSAHVSGVNVTSWTPWRCLWRLQAGSRSWRSVCTCRWTTWPRRCRTSRHSTSPAPAWPASASATSAPTPTPRRYSAWWWCWSEVRRCTGWQKRKLCGIFDVITSIDLAWCASTFRCRWGHICRIVASIWRVKNAPTYK